MEITAEIRRRFGIQGLSLKEALIFRNKLNMKYFFRSKGVPVVDFWDEYTYKDYIQDDILYITKPVDSYGSFNIEKLNGGDLKKRV